MEARQEFKWCRIFRVDTCKASWRFTIFFLGGGGGGSQHFLGESDSHIKRPPGSLDLLVLILAGTFAGTNLRESFKDQAQHGSISILLVRVGL